MTATRSWNAAIASLGVCLAAFLASVAAAVSGWHPSFTERAAGASALALFGCGAWLLLAARRLGPPEPEPDDDGPSCSRGCPPGDCLGYEQGWDSPCRIPGGGS